MTLLDRIMTKASKSKDSNIEPFRYIYIYFFFFQRGTLFSLTKFVSVPSA